MAKTSATLFQDLEDDLGPTARELGLASSARCAKITVVFIDNDDAMAEFALIREGFGDRLTAVAEGDEN